MEQYEQKLRKIRQKFYFLNYFCNIMKIQKKNINRTPPVSSGKEKNYSTQQLRAQPAAGLVWSGVISRWEPAASIRAEPVRHSRHRQFLHTSSFLWMWKTTEIWDISAVQFSCSVMSDSLWPHGMQRVRPPFRMDWLDLLAVQETLKSLLQHHSSKASILWHSAFFIVQLSHPYRTTGKTIALTRQTFVGKVTSLLVNMLSRLVITFLPQSKCLLIWWLQLPSAVILEPPNLGPNWM